jgi:hypothetical protein
MLAPASFCFVSFWVIWIEAITIFLVWRNATTIHVFLILPLQFSTSLKYVTEYV